MYIYQDPQELRGRQDIEKWRNREEIKRERQREKKKEDADEQLCVKQLFFPSDFGSCVYL